MDEDDIDWEKILAEAPPTANPETPEDYNERLEYERKLKEYLIEDVELAYRADNLVNPIKRINNLLATEQVEIDLDWAMVELDVSDEEVMDWYLDYMGLTEEGLYESFAYYPAFVEEVAQQYDITEETVEDYIGRVEEVWRWTYSYVISRHPMVESDDVLEN